MVGDGTQSLVLSASSVTLLTRRRFFVRLGISMRRAVEEKKKDPSPLATGSERFIRQLFLSLSLFRKMMMMMSARGYHSALALTASIFLFVHSNFCIACRRDGVKSLRTTSFDQ